MALSTQVQRQLNAGMARKSLARELTTLIDAGSAAPTVKQERALRMMMASKQAAAAEVVTFQTSRPATGSLTIQAARNLRAGVGRKSAGAELDTVLTTTTA